MRGPAACPAQKRGEAGRTTRAPAFSGFYIGGSAGVYHVSLASAAGTFFGAGPEIGYSWLLGKKDNIGVSLGIGATRLFGGNLSGVSFTIPNLRLLNVGVAF